MFENKKIFIFGLARSGYEVAKLLHRHNNKIMLVTNKTEDNNHIEELKKLGIEVIVDTNQEQYLDSSFDFVIKNPGISLNHPLLKKAEELNIKVTNEVEVAYSFKPESVKIIGITGSLGKTTTTTLIYELLKKTQLPVHLAGNIGLPVSALIEETKENDIWILEISGHQLHDTINFKSDISVLVNLEPVHLDHFGTFNEYKKNKLKIFKNSDLGIICLDNREAYESTKDIDIQKLYYSLNKKTDIYLDDNNIIYQNEIILNTNDIKIVGEHNYQNIMAMILVAKQFNISNELIKKFVKSFKGVEHRIEFVREINGAKIYNDSKSTHPEATVSALKVFKTPVILILGGMNRQEPLDILSDYISNIKLIVGYGETFGQIKDFCDKMKIEMLEASDMEDATKKAINSSNNLDTILFSPAHASWGTFRDFEERGEKFKQIVNMIK